MRSTGPANHFLNLASKAAPMAWACKSAAGLGAGLGFALESLFLLVGVFDSIVTSCRRLHLLPNRGHPHAPILTGRIYARLRRIRRRVSVAGGKTLETL